MPLKEIVPRMTEFKERTSKLTAIAGIVYFDEKPVDPGILDRMGNILGPYGRDARHTWHEPGAGLLRTLCRITP